MQAHIFSQFLKNVIELKYVTNISMSTRSRIRILSIICDNVSEDSLMHRIHQKNIVDSGERFRCNYFLFLILSFDDPKSSFRWSTRQWIFWTIWTIQHITVSIPIANKTLTAHERLARKRYKHARNKTLRISTPTERECAKRGSTPVLGGGLRGLSDALSYWSTIWDLVVLPPFGCRCSESTRRTGPRGLDLPTNRKERGLQVQRVRRIVHATQRALFKLKLFILCSILTGWLY